MRLKKLDIFIAKQFLQLFVGTFFVCQFVLMMQFLWRYVDELIGKGLSMEVLVQFFWYMGLMLMPQAFPLAILLSALITFGNLGESSELTAIKAAGISLMQAFRSLIAITIFITIGSFFFQNVVTPSANMSFAQLLISMKQKSPELEIPEGIFYDGIPNCNLYVQKKDLESGKLYGVMIYRMNGSFDDAAIILADSGMLQSTAEKKHLVLTLWSGEWFENMRSQEFGQANVPYRRETFSQKRIVLDFDADLNLIDAGALSNNERGKSIERIRHDIDSMNAVYDSIGQAYYHDMRRNSLHAYLSKKDSLRVHKEVAEARVPIDSLLKRSGPEGELKAITTALSRLRFLLTDIDFKGMITSDGDRLIRLHQIEAINKFTLALSCLIFFFIGAPLGAIIRKGGLGIPVIISVLVFIIYYILDNTGYRMARGGMWAIWFGKGLATAVLTPLAVFFTYKANNDSVVFNIDVYRNFFQKLFGIRQKRHIFRKEVIIEDPSYSADAEILRRISQEAETYDKQHHLLRAPSVIKTFFKYEPDHAIERICEEMESVVEDLSNTRDKVILTGINMLPVISDKAHTRPFEKKWLNIMAAIVFPLGAILYIRMWRYRLRLHRDLKAVQNASAMITERINNL